MYFYILLFYFVIKTVIRQFLGFVSADENVVQVGFVIDMFVEQSSKFTQHNRVINDESIREVIQYVVEMVGQCSRRDDSSR